MSVQHFLLVYDRAAGRLLHEQTFERRAEALRARFAQERELRGTGDNLEIVVIDAHSREDLMRTHARYFLSLEELAARMTRA